MTRSALRAVWERSPSVRGRVASLVIVLVIAVGVVGYWQLLRPTVPCSDGVPVHSGQSFLNWVGPYASLDVAVEHSDLIVVGRYLGAREAAIPEGMTGTLSFTDFDFEVEEYLLGSGRDSVVIRERGDLEHREAPGPALDQPMLLYLRQDSSGLSAGPFNRMCERGGSIYFAWGGEGAPMEVPYFAGMTLAEAADAVRLVVTEAEGGP